VQLRPLDRLADEDVEPDLLERLGDLLVVARQLDQVVDELGELLELVDDVGDQPRRARRGELVGDCCRNSMLVRRLVTGVRSSCEASATSWRCARADSSSLRIVPSSAASIALKLRARLPSSSRRRSSIRAAEVVGRGDVLGAPRVRRRTGASVVRATNQPSSAASAMPIAATISEDHAQVESVESCSLSERSITTATPGDAAASTR
jgi:hypothetical protein